MTDDVAKVDPHDDVLLACRRDAGHVISDMVRDRIVSFAQETGLKAKVVELPASARTYLDCYATYKLGYRGPWPMQRLFGCDLRYGQDFKVF